MRGEPELGAISGRVMGDDVRTLLQLLLRQVDEVIADTSSLGAERRLCKGFGFELLLLLLVFLAEFFSRQTATQQIRLHIPPPPPPSSSSSSSSLLMVCICTVKIGHRAIYKSKLRHQK